MRIIKERYEQSHPKRKGGSVTHVQFYISASEQDDVPADEQIQMVRELIERTALRDFPSTFAPHRNTDIDHVHISCCPFSIDGTHKLCVNKKLLYDLRREMDRICVEHGYSIIEAPELFGDKEYKAWFMSIKESGTVTIHPPRERSNEKHKRAKSYAKAKTKQAETKAAKLTEYKRLIGEYTDESAHLFYTSPALRDPSDPAKPIRLRCVTEEGREVGELELSAAALYLWTEKAAHELERRGFADMKFAARVRALKAKAGNAALLARDLDVRTIEELIAHTKEVGSDIGTLRRDIQRQGAILPNEAKYDEKARERALRRKKCGREAAEVALGGVSEAEGGGSGASSGEQPRTVARVLGTDAAESERGRKTTE